MPKDPLQLKIEKLRQKPNIYAEELFTQDYQPLSAILSDQDRAYLSSYGREAFADLVQEDRRLGQTTNMFEN